MNEGLGRVAQKLGEGGFVFIDVPVLLPLEDFLMISGEEFRRRLFITTDSHGRDFCLRPEFTLPLCRKVLKEHPEGGRFAYRGRVFHNGRDGDVAEAWQAGVEIIGHEDPLSADIEAFTLALRLVRALGIAEPFVVCGDLALFAALLDALEVPPAWRRRLTALFGDPLQVVTTLQALSRGSGGTAALAADREIVAALGQFPAERVGALFTELLGIAGIRTSSGRSAAEIAERVLEQALLASEAHLPASRIQAIADFTEIETPVGEGARALDVLSARIGRPAVFEAAVAAFAAREKVLVEAVHGYGNVRFSGGFGRKLGYYDGLIFDIFDADKREVGPVAGGGRYDGLITALKGPAYLKAVGFALWMERFS